MANRVTRMVIICGIRGCWRLFRLCMMDLNMNHLKLSFNSRYLTWQSKASRYHKLASSEERLVLKRIVTFANTATDLSGYVHPKELIALDSDLFCIEQMTLTGPKQSSLYRPRSVLITTVSIKSPVLHNLKHL